MTAARTRADIIVELSTIPRGCAVLDRYGDVWQLRGELWCSYETAPVDTAQVSRHAPFIVLGETRRIEGVQR